MEYWKGMHRARSAARIWSHLEASGSLLPALDLLIAATALGHGLSLATAHMRGFSRVAELKLIDVGG